MTPITSWSTRLESVASFANDSATSSWLQEAGSITARLRRRWPELQVEVLDEGLRAPQPDECERLNVGQDAICWVREVQLHESGHLLVHARTVIVDWSDHNPWHKVSALGQRPLGELLFSLPDLQRSPLEFALARPLPSEHNRRIRTTPARRRVFLREGVPLLLTEAFDLLTVPVAAAQKAVTALR